MITAGSSLEDEAALIPDRVERLSEMKNPVKTSTGIMVTDIVHFFKGDAPAQQIEMGTQQGGNYKCGACGIHTSMIDDITHALECKWRSVADLQALVLKGDFGKEAGVIKPFENLSFIQLQKELRLRNIYHTSTNKKDATAILQAELRGVQSTTITSLQTFTAPIRLKFAKIHHSRE